MCILKSFVIDVVICHATQMEAAAKQCKQEYETFKNAKKDDQEAIALLGKCKQENRAFKSAEADDQDAIALLEQVPDAPLSDSGSNKGENQGAISQMTMTV